MKKILSAVVAVVIIVGIVGIGGMYYKNQLSEEAKYKKCLQAQGISNSIAKVVGDEPTNACNE
ncbi:hypothetical protein MHZ92_11940 [Sporosarcina sp. ACRSL]|uniref:hypothetical protein n=1 Tax=Sporosarcina sp. ACRSL TaxID=2918215 RepID=UPI001EF6990F|nr:hypothetical protein [Sporosarcina sp. ACRSL]MCG7344848.1 hypothetical protein [Sporosarcina sp. ACRSL]